jgi:hypothetical protein
LFVGSSQTPIEGNSLVVRIGEYPHGRKHPGADYRAVINNGEARVELLVQAGTEENAEVHRGILESYPGATSQFHPGAAREKSVLRIESQAKPTVEGIPLLVFCVEYLCALDQLFRPYILKYWPSR